MSLNHIPEYEPLDHSTHHDWNSVMSISLGELVDYGFIDFSSEKYDFDSYNDEQRNRFWEKFLARYRFRDISITPPEKWRLRLIAVLNEVMPKYKFLYKALEDGKTPLMAGDEYHKRREIRSDFPQTQLSGQEDYASEGNDLEYETIHEADFIETADRIARSYRDVDVMLLDECERLFSQIYSTHINGL